MADLATLHIRVESGEATRNVEKFGRAADVAAERAESLADAASSASKEAKDVSGSVRDAARNLEALRTASADAAGGVGTLARAIATGLGTAAGLAVTHFVVKFIDDMQKAKREAEQFAEEWEKTMRRLTNAGDVADLTKMAQDIYLGTPAEQFKDGIVEAQRAVDELKARNQTAIGALSQIFNAEPLREAEERLASLTTKFAELQRRILDTRNVPFRTQGLLPVTISADMDDVTRATEDAGRAALTAAERYERLLAAASGFARITLGGNPLGLDATRERIAREQARLPYVPGSPVLTLPGTLGSGDLWKGRRDLTDAEQVNKQIAENFRENLQRATGDVFADFISTGKLSVGEVFAAFRDIGSQLIGQTLSRALTSHLGNLSGSQSMGLGIGFGIVGGVIETLVSSGEKYRAQIEAITRATQDFQRGVEGWRMSAAEWAMSPAERAAAALSSQASQFGRDAYGIYRETPFSAEQGRFFELLARTGFKTTGDWQRDLGAIEGLDPSWINNGLAGPLREYLEALRLIAEGYEENTEAATRQAAAERALSLSRTASTLTAFGRDLRLSNLSIYNPFQQRQDAEAEYNRLVTAARGGDQDAASQLPAAARAFLESSRSINASGSRYVADYQRVERDNVELTGRFKAEEDLQRQIADGTIEVIDGISFTNEILTRTDGYVQAQLVVQQETGLAVRQVVTEVRNMSAEMARRIARLEEVLVA